MATCFLRGKTDNQSNTYALSKWMSTKFPLTFLIMEFSETLRLGRCELSLDWIARDFNQFADDLTNNDFEKFVGFPGSKEREMVGPGVFLETCERIPC